MRFFFALSLLRSGLTTMTGTGEFCRHHLDIEFGFRPDKPLRLRPLVPTMSESG